MLPFPGTSNLGITTMNKKLSILLLSLLLPFGCIKEFQPGDYGESPSYVVVDAVINDQQEQQLIRISKSTLMTDSEYLHLPDCKVKVVDILGNEFLFQEKNNSYEGLIDTEFLYLGNSFKIHFSIPEGKEYESAYEELKASPPIDSVYYILDESQTKIQFYVDFQSAENYSKYYKWDLEETHEHHATWPIGNYYTDNKFVYVPYSWDLFVCYSTLQIKRIYSASTVNLNENSSIKIPLNTVDNSTQRLFHRYSLLVSQASLSADAYSYWETLKKNNQESGGLYDSQPSNSEGNVKCLSSPEEKVLGYFGVSSISYERVFIDEVPDLTFPDYFECAEVPIEITEILSSTETSWPIYFVPVPAGYPGYLTGDYDCFDCREEGGDTIPPDYWRVDEFKGLAD